MLMYTKPVPVFYNKITGTFQGRQSQASRKCNAMAWSLQANYEDFENLLHLRVPTSMDFLINYLSTDAVTQRSLVATMCVSCVLPMSEWACHLTAVVLHSRRNFSMNLASTEQLSG